MVLRVSSDHCTVSVQIVCNYCVCCAILMWRQILRARNYYQVSNRARLPRPDTEDTVGVGCDCGKISAELRQLKINMKNLQVRAWSRCPEH